jgi:hypothetical protein
MVTISNDRSDLWAMPIGARLRYEKSLISGNTACVFGIGKIFRSENVMSWLQHYRDLSDHLTPVELKVSDCIG